MKVIEGFTNGVAIRAGCSFFVFNVSTTAFCLGKFAAKTQDATTDVEHVILDVDNGLGVEFHLFEQTYRAVQTVAVASCSSRQRCSADRRSVSTIVGWMCSTMAVQAAQMRLGTL